jgi:tetratricopeptide (TPR) repeat protein
MGLDDLAAVELQRALGIDPTNESLKDLKVILPHLRVDPDAWLAANQQIPSNFVHFDPWYYLRKGLLDDAQKAIDERSQKAANDPQLLLQQGLLFALRGKFSQAMEKVPAILARVQSNLMSRHHLTYDAACIYALSGDSTDAVKWLRETANTGFPNYSLFERDPFLNRIRQSPEFIQFMTEQKAHWEKLRVEFRS